MSVWSKILDLLFPPRCPFCGKLLNDWDKGLCRGCEKILPYVQAAEQGRKLKNITLCVAPLYYEGCVRESLLRYKFKGVTAYRQVFADFIAKCIDENQISCDIITWVPLSRKRLRRRGYDQARLIAEAAARELALPCERLLKKIRDNPPQSSTGGAEKRRANAAGAYACPAPELVRGRRVLIIDDIVTTGSTLSECAGILKAAGAATIYAAAAAQRRD